MARKPEEEGAAGLRNPGIERQQQSAVYWRREAERYRPTGDAIIALGSPVALEYLAALGRLRYVAQNGVTRRDPRPPGESGRQRTHYDNGDGSGMHVSMQAMGGESMPPKHSAAAMAKLKAEEQWMRRRMPAIESWLDEHVGESPSEPVRMDDAA